MKYLKLFESFNDIDSICRKFGIENYTINEDGSIDVDGNVNLSRKQLTNLPLKFRNVTGYFDCNNNQLTSLEGGPKSVGGSFNCANNQLKTLEGGPKSVGASFLCNNNQLISLKGCPELVYGYFRCHNNQLTSLEGGPKSVNITVGDFYCNNNKLTSLDGFPKSLRGYFYFDPNPCYKIYVDWINSDRRDELLDMMKDYDFLRGNTINWYLLEAFFNDAGFPVPIRKDLEKYYTIED
jgi:hypothetical protein